MPVSGSDPPIVRDLVLKVFETNGRLVDSGNALVRPAGLTTAWWQVLGALGYSLHPLPVAHIARNMGLTRQGVQRVVDLLVARGLVALEDNPHHQRARLVVLTTAGRRALASAEAAVEPLDRKILARIGADRIAVAISVLSEMNEVLARHLHEPAAFVATSEKDKI
ncbi:winged helix-turn-helix transcriptional regulator [Bradyrhizobium diazoefficiens]|nr:MarR family winged helix-turn-helix transcriptional regulator [Bradyrhizobium diazoefficiens]UCF53017.1 MAG: winged helix-turn-helix transcriptional regulator [Bradyrhizobium sp.]MBR0963712.1 winged helix-turn-helix transcriptional regulator [Bradyrhizobium diazoefficiens]MBR0977864.1 winged helix-turn-helix transcriptional regulator [Bradyrhizobium diazoefficiens]MBR1007374.1 winged helix-turn-helix transcriptional regulator [Bradyrhizobium diazoefficiens]MBR1012785.1 winged helix-turn-hel